jgi:hypothetical protein
MEKLNQKLNVLPTVSDYAKLLCLVCAKESINTTEARKKYGQFTYKQWYEILNNYNPFKK